MGIRGMMVPVIAILGCSVGVRWGRLSGGQSACQSQGKRGGEKKVLHGLAPCRGGLSAVASDGVDGILWKMFRSPSRRATASAGTRVIQGNLAKTYRVLRIAVRVPGASRRWPDAHF